MDDASPRCTAVIVNYGSSGLVAENLDRLAGGWPELAVIIVDSFSTLAERERVRTMCDARGWAALLLDENVGFGGGVNRGAAQAFARGADVLIVINPDAWMAPESGRTLASAAASDPDALVAPTIRRPDGSLWTEGADLYLDDGTMAGVRFRDSHPGRDRMFWVSGACFALSRALWHRLGGFDDDYFLYWEDVDLSRKVHDLGGRVAVLDGVVAIHDEGGTHDDRSAGRAKSETYYYYNIRNRLLFARLRLPPATQRGWRRTALRVSWSILLQGGRRQLLTSRAPWRALRRGLRDGRRGVSGPVPR